MKIFNTMTMKKEKFVPLTPNKALIYGCGPTVYNFIHVGNARMLIAFDVLRRYLKHIGYDVTYVQNFTDIDDKVIRRAADENLGYEFIAARYIKEFERDAAGLNVLPADLKPLATPTFSRS